MKDPTLQTVRPTSRKPEWWLAHIREDLEYVPPESRRERYRLRLDQALYYLGALERGFYRCFELGGLVRADRRLLELLRQADALSPVPDWPGRGEPTEPGSL